MPEAVRDKTIVVRVDFNVPLKNGVVVDNTRIVETIPTLEFLIENGAKRIHILTHIGRPKGEHREDLSTQHIREELQKCLGHTVEFRPDLTASTSPIQLHENTRFWAGEKNNDPEFSQLLYDNLAPDVFVNDGFSVSHRAHGSVVGLADFVPCFAGFLLEKEIQELSPFLTDEKMPGLTVVISGIKMETKIPVLEHFAKIADNVILGGGIANTFLVAQGYTVGNSVYQEEYVKNARRILKIANQNKTGMHIPIDVVCADSINAQEAVTLPADEGLVNLSIFDIGQRTIYSYCEILHYAKTIVWNGPVGVMENPIFAKGTYGVLECIRNQKDAKTIIGGGDTLKALKKWNVPKSEFSHVSTGGGSMLEFLQGLSLPGIEIVLEQ